MSGVKSHEKPLEIFSEVNTQRGALRGPSPSRDENISCYYVLNTLFRSVSVYAKVVNLYANINNTDVVNTRNSVKATYVLEVENFSKLSLKMVLIDKKVPTHANTPIVAKMAKYH